MPGTSRELAAAKSECNRLKADVVCLEDYVKQLREIAETVKASLERAEEVAEV